MIQQLRDKHAELRKQFQAVKAELKKSGSSTPALRLIDPKAPDRQEALQRERAKLLAGMTHLAEAISYLEREA